jgi:dUTP pyrophosphatase
LILTRAEGCGKLVNFMMDHPAIQLRRLQPERDMDIPLPAYMTPMAAGMDVCAAIETDQHLAPGDIALIPTGLAVAIPKGFEIQVRPRSGLAIKHGISIVNAPGTIDADYRGEIKIGLINLGSTSYTVRRGDRIAQLIVQQVYQASITLVDELDETQRNEGGFGHTGK